jgi:hypothetical protein
MLSTYDKVDLDVISSLVQWWYDLSPGSSPTCRNMEIPPREASCLVHASESKPLFPADEACSYTSTIST